MAFEEHANCLRSICLSCPISLIVGGMIGLVTVKYFRGKKNSQSQESQEVQETQPIDDGNEYRKILGTNAGAVRRRGEKKWY